MPAQEPSACSFPRGSTRAAKVRRRAHLRSPLVEALENRLVLSVSVLNNSGNGYSALSFAQSGGYVPPDTCGAAGPSAYVETVNQSLALFPNKATGSGAVTDSLSHFLFSTGALSRADSGSGLSDPIVTYDEKISRFIVGDQDVDFGTHVSAFDLAVSKTNNPATLSASDWTFYKITTTETGEDADYPGNFGYNADAFVFTLNMFPATSGTYHVQVVSVKAADLQSASATPQVFRNDLADFSVRATAMHDSVAGDPMWLVTEHGDGLSIDVYKMTNVLSTSPTFLPTNVAVTRYSGAVAPLNPNGASITTNIDSRIMKAAEANNTIVAAHSVAVSLTQDVIQWYAFDVSSGTPTLAQQGRVSGGNNTYLTYPGIDINASGSMGMSFIRSGTDTSTDFMSMDVTGRIAADAAGTMEAPVVVPSGAGQANYSDFANPHRAGDLSGINLDPTDGTFWAANEFANTQGTANWGTAVANFAASAPTNSADMAVTNTGPSSVTAGTNATYTVTITNNGPNTAAGVVLTDTLPAGSVLVSMTPAGGNPDTFTSAQSGGTVSESAASIPSGHTDSFALVVSAPSTLTPGSDFSNSASVSSTTADPNTSNNTAKATGTIVGASADLAVANTDSGPANEGDQITYTVTVTNKDTTNPGTGVVLTDTLGANLSFVSATTSQGTFSQSGGVVTFTIGTISPNSTVTLTVIAQATEDGSLTNSASVSATSADPNLANNSATATTNVPEVLPVVSGSPVAVTTRSVSNLTTATFTHASGIEPASAFEATIDWGDGSTSRGTISQAGTTYSVVGSHHYHKPGTHTVTTSVIELGASAELLLAKVGDEVPDLPPHLKSGHDGHGLSLRGEANRFASLVDVFLNQAPGTSGAGVTTLADLRNDLVTLFGASESQGASLVLSTLVGSLQARNRGNARVVDTLLLIGEVAAEYGN